MPRLAVYQPDIAQNLGAMIRTCACLGVPVDVIGPCGFPFSVRGLKAGKGMRRAAMDYADLADITHHTSWAAYRRVAAPTGRLIVLSTRATTALWDHSFAAGDTLLVGRESAGLPEEVHACADVSLTIPMPGGGRSLNVGVSAAMALSEAARQQARLDT